MAWRARRRWDQVEAAKRPMRMAYADPPYPGLSAKYYRGEASYGGEVDHRQLIARLMRDFPEGWALSTSERGLRLVLPLCPPTYRLGVWTKPHRPPPATKGIHNVTEFVIVHAGRQLPPGRPNHLHAHAARRGGTTPGRKPLAFCGWMFGLLGLRPGDELHDLFPGTGVVSRAWRECGGSPRVHLRSTPPTRKKVLWTEGAARVEKPADRGQLKLWTNRGNDQNT